MKTWQVVSGFLVSAFGGALVLWVLIDKIGWGYLKKQDIEEKGKGFLTIPLGIVERILYTTALIIGVPEWVGVWLAIKVAIAWKRWQGDKERPTYNLFLIGNALSIMFGLIGAWIALGYLPIFKK